MAFLVANNGRTDGTVCVDKIWRVVKPGERFSADVSPSAWTHNIKVVKQNITTGAKSSQPSGARGHIRPAPVSVQEVKNDVEAGGQ